ncbi:N/A [soil metagenome]
MAAKTVLLVNGDRSTRLIYQTILEREGLAVFQAATGPEALDQTERYLPDLIVQELSLGAWDGCDFIRAVKASARTRHILFLVISAYVLEADQERVRLAGGDAFLPKPCPPSRMLVEVLRLLATPAP